jgi:hypothetical protein
MLARVHDGSRIVKGSACECVGCCKYADDHDTVQGSMDGVE